MCTWQQPTLHTAGHDPHCIRDAAFVLPLTQLQWVKDNMLEMLCGFAADDAGVSCTCCISKPQSYSGCEVCSWPHQVL
jgi:hypothetical protein